MMGIFGSNKPEILRPNVGYIHRNPNFSDLHSKSQSNYTMRILATVLFMPVSFTYLFGGRHTGRCGIKYQDEMQNMTKCWVFPSS